jgi:hypothetical protein
MTAPAHFLLQIEDEPHVVEEAEELGGALPPYARTAGASCDARVAISVERDIPVTVQTDGGIFAFVGPPAFDPGDPVVSPLLKSIARRLDGFFCDNATEPSPWEP